VTAVIARFPLCMLETAKPRVRYSSMQNINML
jgi:hypothetical protein